MATKCYAMVRGSSIRVTGLGSRGQIPDPIRYAVSKSVATVTINEVTEPGSNEMLKTPEDENRIHLVQPTQTIRYTVDIDFLRVDPGVLSLVAGVPVAYGYGTPYRFGEGGFGEGGFGGGLGSVNGFDSRTRQPAAAFALEVWSRLVGQRCPDTGLPQWGYTVFPFLRGGRLSGFKFENGLVSFSLRTAQARRMTKWGVGPYDLEGPYQRLLTAVSRNNMFRQIITTAVPPEEQDGIQETTDIIYGGDAVSTSADIIDGEHVVTSPWVVEGGGAL